MGDSGGRWLSSRSTALFLYVVLVGLPAVVFGALLFRELNRDQDRQLAELPLECTDAAERLGAEAATQVRELLTREANREFWKYRKFYYKNDLGPITENRSPLIEKKLPEGILGWFSFRNEAGSQLPEITVLRGPTPPGPDPIAGRISELVSASVAAPILEESVLADFELLRAQQEEGYASLSRPYLRTVVLNLSEGSTLDCKAAIDADPRLQSTDDEDGQDRHSVYVQPMSLRVILREGERYPSVIGTRSISIPRLVGATSLPSCIDAIERTVHLVQGFVVDSEWIFEKMPQEVAARILSIGQELVVAQVDDPAERGEIIANIEYFERLSSDLDLGSALPPIQLRVRTDASSLRRDFRGHNAWFGGMAFILTVSMAIGIRLLLSSIRASRVETERTRNFVASVTHELRTPIAAVKLYGEMLHDGWVQGEEKRTEYLARIVHESDRLDGLVDRVLLRRKLFDKNHNPVPGDLNEEILQQQEGLTMVAGRPADDIVFELSPGLPHVFILPDGIHVIVQNLVENARKYAPVDPSAEGIKSEPILVRTRMSQKGNVLLEVLDRGPGIPEKDRGRVFEAFLRLGEESTRTTKGTGLGLHLVALQARAMRGKVRALPRADGGTVFQVQLKRA